MIVWYILEACKIELAALPVYLLLRKPWKNWSKREAALGAFILFMMGLLPLAFQGDYNTPGIMLHRAYVRLKTGTGINLVPFRSITSYFRYYDKSSFLVNFWGNIVMFIPWGFGLVLLWRRNQKPGLVILHSFALTLSIETIQLFIGRSVDVDDLILNFCGSFLGAVLYFVIKKICPRIQDFAI